MAGESPEHQSGKDAQALFLIGLWTDEGRRLHATVERIGTNERLDVAGWEELLQALQQCTSPARGGGEAVNPDAVTMTLDRLAAWYAAQPPLDRLILSRLIAGNVRADVQAFGSASDDATTLLLEPDEIVQLGSLFTDSDLRVIRALLRTSDE